MTWRILPVASFLVIAASAMAQTPVAGPVLSADPEPAATGAAPPETVDLDMVLRLAQTANPRIAVEEQEVAGAQADRMTAGALPNPLVTFTGSYQPGHLDTNYTGHRAYEGNVQFPLLLGGKRGARIAAANRRIDAARSRVALTRLEIAADAGAAFVMLLAAQETADVRQLAVVELDRLRSVVAGRRSAGVASDYDLVRVDVEVESARADLANAEADVISAQTDLANALGVASWHPRASGQLGRLAQLPVGPPRSIDELPVVAAAIADGRVARADIVAARRERFPEVAVITDRFWTTGPFSDTYTTGLAVRVPLFDRRIGPVRRAEADARAAEFRIQLVRARAAAEIDRYAAQVATRSSALVTFNRQIGTKLPSLGRMAEDAYRLRGGSVIELIDATRSRFETEVKRIDLSSKLAEATLRLELARGNPPANHP